MKKFIKFCVTFCMIAIIMITTLVVGSYILIGRKVSIKVNVATPTEDDSIIKVPPEAYDDNYMVYFHATNYIKQRYKPYKEVMFFQFNVQSLQKKDKIYLLHGTMDIKCDKEFKDNIFFAIKIYYIGEEEDEYDSWKILEGYIGDFDINELKGE